jgi:hypothetical protein
VSPYTRPAEGGRHSASDLKAVAKSPRIKSRIERLRQPSKMGTPGDVLISLRLLNPCNRCTYRAQCRSQFFIAFVLAAGPEESLQTVSLSAWHDMDMEMGDALADAVVGGDECALRLHSQFDSSSKHFCIREKGRYERLRQILDGFKVIPGNKQAVSGKQGAMVQEGDGVYVLENTGAVVISNNFTEGTIFVEWSG